MGVGKEEEKTGSGGGRGEGNDRENAATLKGPWPDEKVISEPTVVGPALRFGNAGHSGGSGERCGVGGHASPPQATAGEKGAVSHGCSGEFLKKNPVVRTPLTSWLWLRGGVRPQRT